MLKKGALFGLDARIALSIFGALSIISGAALFGAIQGSQVTAEITKREELGKAFDQYFLDTRQNVPRSSVFVDHYNTNNLITNSANIPGWNGPYLTDYITATDANGEWLRHSKTGKYAIIIYKRDNFENGLCATATPCFLWVRIDHGLEDQSLLEAIDKEVDGVVDPDNGNFVYKVSGSALLSFYKYAPISQKMIY